MFSMSIGCDGLPGHSSVLLSKISLGEGRCGPTGCVLIFSSRSSTGSFASWHVDSAVLIVLICHSMNPFDLG